MLHPVSYISLHHSQYSLKEEGGCQALSLARVALWSTFPRLSCRLPQWQLGNIFPISHLTLESYLPLPPPLVLRSYRLWKWTVHSIAYIISIVVSIFLTIKNIIFRTMHRLCKENLLVLLGNWWSFTHLLKLQWPILKTPPPHRFPRYIFVASAISSLCHTHLFFLLLESDFILVWTNPNILLEDMWYNTPQTYCLGFRNVHPTKLNTTGPMPP
jgi:hypothetical protein